MQAEGVIKFDLRYTPSAPTPAPGLEELIRWRNILWQEKLLGQDPDRYGGYGFGNVSQRIAPFSNKHGLRTFVISGTQTGKLDRLDISNFAIVNTCDVGKNQVIASGPVQPSSEALTHAAIYEQNDLIHVILHVHSPDIWKAAGAQNIPQTDPSVDYGTPAMAQEVHRLFNESHVRKTGIFTMGGHEDGVVSFGADAEQAGQVLLAALGQCRNQGNTRIS